MGAFKTKLSEDEIIKRAKKIKMLMLDVDGVMTDGRIIYGDYGDEFKCFDVLDGFGVVLLKRAGFKVTIVTAKKSKIVKMRAQEIQADSLYQNCTDKIKAFNEILEEFSLSPHHVCFVGDDLVDIPVLKKAGLAICVPNAVAEVKDHAHLITGNQGGRGAVREVCEFLLKFQGKWDNVTKNYLK
jgi:3-deoxy-D-manno-octulosonate 8-phosphate phosphatase (KDO 8-P phosphatase)